ncbi:quinone oxidoreductase [Scheffersomyces coipomensis]|uniref:quinone oxidoreductase n=1 Tax=Scheffersomyces coipomensis TaxID=1788519 RepID=UPI00315D31BC
MSIESTQIIVKTPPQYALNYEWNQPDSTFEIRKVIFTPETDLKEGQVFVKTLYLSNDPFTRGVIQKVENQTLPKGRPVASVALGEVLESKNTLYKKGDVVTGIWNWSEYAIPSVIYYAIDKASKLPFTYYISVIGIAPLTAYFGLTKILKFNSDVTSETYKAKNLIIISAATGAVGAAAVQLSKHNFGISTVVGITGTDSKAKWVESIGADKAFNYNDPDFESQLSAYVTSTGGADYYFDNVGGPVLNSVLPQLNTYGKVAACGNISNFKNANNALLPNWVSIISKRLNITGLTVHDYIPEFPKALSVLEKAIEEKKLATENAYSVEDISDKSNKFELVPLVWKRIFDGSKPHGKIITKIVRNIPK